MQKPISNSKTDYYSHLIVLSSKQSELGTEIWFKSFDVSRLSTSWFLVSFRDEYFHGTSIIVSVYSYIHPIWQLVLKKRYVFLRRNYMICLQRCYICTRADCKTMLKREISRCLHIPAKQWVLLMLVDLNRKSQLMENLMRHQTSTPT